MDRGHLRGARTGLAAILSSLTAYLLDSDWSIQAMRLRPDAVNTIQRLRGGGITVSWVTVAEVYEGAYRSPNPQGLLMAFRRFFSPFTVFNRDNTIAERFGEVRADLRRRGELIPDLDLLIAATALAYGLTLLTFNRAHFERVPDLRLYRLT